MSWKKETMPTMIDAVSTYRGTRIEDRLPRWEARLRVNEQELRNFMAIPLATHEPQLTAPRLPLKTETVTGSRSYGASDASAIAGKVRSKEVSALEVAEDYIAKAEAVTGLNLFTSFDGDLMREEARSVDARIAKGEDVGPLAGVPVPIKDFMFVKGYPRTGGTRALPASTDHDDAPVVANVRRAGAVMAGMTNLHELAYGATGINPHFGRVGNPHSPDHLVGGSSSGAAASIAAGLTPISVGSDTSGSIRIPSTFCGVVGLKPSYDRIDRAGVLPLAWSLDHLGPIGRTVEDAALLYAVMAEIEPAAVCPSNDAAISGIRFGKPSHYFYDDVDDEILARIDQIIERLALKGHSINPVAVPSIENCLPIHIQTVTAEASQVYWEAVEKAPEVLGEDVRVRLEVGQFLSSVDYVKAQQLRTMQRENLQAVLKDVHVLITPTVATVAPRIDDEFVVINGKVRPMHPALTRFTTPFNQSGLPAMTLPCGFNSAGLPMGLQLAAAFGEEKLLLQVAQQVQAVIAEL